VSVIPTLRLLSPLAGWCAPLEDVPDPVFAERMLGDGLSIDPTSAIVHAPCEGEILAVPAGGHAVSIRSARGVDILIHVGIDTVQLRGRGFEVQARAGQQVVAGEPLIRFDLDALARAAKSLVTPVVITTASGYEIRHRHARGAIRVGELLLELGPAGATVATGSAAPSTAGATITRRVRVPLAHGLHARPAALLAHSLKGCVAEVTLAAGDRTANARSVVAVMALGVRKDDEIAVHATGLEAEAAIEAVVRGLEQAVRSEAATPVPQDAPVAIPKAAAPGAGRDRAAARPDGAITGVAAVPGFAVGRAARIERPEIEVIEAGAGVSHEHAELERARQAVRARLVRVAAVGGGSRRDIIAAHIEFLEDPTLDQQARAWLERGKSAGFAWRAATQTSIAALEQLTDERLRERIDDLRDIEAHVLLALRGEARPMNITLPERAVLFAEELLPSELVALDRDRLEAICLAGGGATSHVAILAAAMNVPMLVGLGAPARAVTPGTEVIVDADTACVHLAPSAAALAAASTLVAKRRGARAEERAAAQRDCYTADGVRIEIFANVGSAADAALAIANGAEGCGLLRTEFLFLERTVPPDEDEQLTAYQAVATALGGRPLVLRLLDVGGDKPLSYLELPPEDNPALGLRGIRTSLWRPELLTTQLAAALRVEPASSLRILLPMITDLEEVRTVRAAIETLRAQSGRRAPVEIGAMIETPAAALLAGALAAEVDFLSIGSNDLSQYTLAMDRGHAELARRIDALHPAVLRLIAMTAEAGRALGKTVAVCGGVAADPAAVPVLLGLGVRELSVVPAAIPRLKRQVANLSLDACRELAARCLAADSADAVRLEVSRHRPAREST
jgi:phosphocarrier protein FPr/phosphocarrier protein